MQIKIYLNETPYRYEEIADEVSLADFRLAYSYDGRAPSTSIQTRLNQVYRKFNVDHPEDYQERSLSIGDIIMLDKGSAWAVSSTGFKKVSYNLDETITSVLLERMEGRDARLRMRLFEGRVRELQDRWDPIIELVRELCGDKKYCPESVRYIEMLMSYCEEHGLP